MTTKGHQLSCSLCALASLISVGTFFSFLNSNVFWYRRFRRFSLLAIPSFISYSSSALVVVSIQYSVSTSDPFNDRLPTFAVYANSFLATLNARRILRATIRPDGMGESMLVSLPDCVRNSKLSQVCSCLRYLGFHAQCWFFLRIF